MCVCYFPVIVCMCICAWICISVFKCVSVRNSVAYFYFLFVKVIYWFSPERAVKLDVCSGGRETEVPGRLLILTRG